MSTPHIEHFVDERGNFTFRGEIGCTVLSEEEAKALGKYVSGILDENAKLRELVRDAWGDGHPDRSCEGCDIRDECHNDVERMRKDGMLRFSRCLFELRIEERMRELGVEVDV